MAKPGNPSYCYRYPRPAATADVVVFREVDHAEKASWEILLIQRGKEPFEGHWALPGGFIEPHEDPKTAAQRELREETGIEDTTLHQIGAFGAPGRDPRGWVISVAYWTRLARKTPTQAGDDAAGARWWSVKSLPQQLAFDHDTIITSAIKRLLAQQAEVR